jgi:hypothetical protein
MGIGVRGGKGDNQKALEPKKQNGRAFDFPSPVHSISITCMTGSVLRKEINCKYKYYKH